MGPAVHHDISNRWRVLGRVGLFMFGCAVMLAAVSPLSARVPGLTPELFVGAGTSVGTFILTALFVRWDKLCLSDVGAAPDRRVPALLAFGLLVGLAMVVLWALVLVAFGHVRWVRGTGVGLTAVLVQLLGYVALACREELAFRGYPLRRLEKTFGLWTAQLLVALLFAVEHMVGGWPWERAVFGAGVGSMMFGMAALATRGLAVPIGVHAAWNFGQWMLGLNGIPGIWGVVVEQGQDQRIEQVRAIGYLVVMSVATLAFWLWYRVSPRQCASTSGKVTPADVP